MSVDPLAEDAPDWTPYRYGFNNPLIYTDPDGMFESKDAAKAWAKENDVKTGWFSGNRIRENSDGAWSIDNRGDHTSVSDLGGDLGVMTAVMVSDKDIISTEIAGEFGPLGLYDTRRYVDTHRDGTQSESPLYYGGTTPGGKKGGVNKNSLKAVGRFATYMIKVSGRLFKIGKADAGRVTKSSGLPTRVHTQVRKLRKKHGSDAVDVSVSPLGKTTTREALRTERSILKKIFKRTGKVPPGNKKSFKPKK